MKSQVCKQSQKGNLPMPQFPWGALRSGRPVSAVWYEIRPWWYDIRNPRDENPRIEGRAGPIITPFCSIVMMSNSCSENFFFSKNITLPPSGSVLKAFFFNVDRQFPIKSLSIANYQLLTSLSVIKTMRDLIGFTYKTRGTLCLFKWSVGIFWRRTLEAGLRCVISQKKKSMPYGGHLLSIQGKKAMLNLAFRNYFLL